MSRSRLVGVLVLSGVLILSRSLVADVITGTIVDWPESSPPLVVGDGVHHVTMYWTQQGVGTGFFYGSNFTGDSDVAVATGVSEVGEITAAAGLSFVSGSVGPMPDIGSDPAGDGAFIVYRNGSSGHYGVLHVQDIDAPPGALLQGRWWFQTDGTDSFAPVAHVRGDANADGVVDIADGIAVLAALFIGGPPPPCADAADVNDDGGVDVGDPIYLLVHLFGSGPPIPEPSATCAVDPTDADLLGCGSFPPCAGSP